MCFLVIPVIYNQHIQNGNLKHTVFIRILTEKQQHMAIKSIHLGSRCRDLDDRTRIAHHINAILYNRTKKCVSLHRTYVIYAVHRDD